MKNIIDKYIKRIMVDYPEDDKLQIDLQDFAKEIEEQLRIGGVGSSALTTSDLIAFSKWVDDKMYNHRLQIMPRELTNFYMKNRISIMKQYL